MITYPTTEEVKLRAWEYVKPGRRRKASHRGGIPDRQGFSRARGRVRSFHWREEQECRPVPTGSGQHLRWS